jgi:hypothetical protein
MKINRPYARYARYARYAVEQCIDRYCRITFMIIFRTDIDI